MRKVSEETETAQDFHKLHFRVDAWTGKLASGEVQGGKTNLSDTLKRMNAREFNATAVTQHCDILLVIFYHRLLLDFPRLFHTLRRDFA